MHIKINDHDVNYYNEQNIVEYIISEMLCIYFVLKKYCKQSIISIKKFLNTVKIYENFPYFIIIFRTTTICMEILFLT